LFYMGFVFKPCIYPGLKAWINTWLRLITNYQI
jgi:hypothetical protein